MDLQNERKRDGGEKEKTAERGRSVERIYGAALAEHEEFKKIPEADIKAVISTALTEINALENAAGLEKSLPALTPEVVKDISALWVFAGPGTYDSPVKDDRYKDYPWARGMDRARLSYAALLDRKISEIISKERLSGPVSGIPQRIARARELIQKSGPTILYNGTDSENSVVRDVSKRKGIVVPPEKVRVVGEGIRNTVDQIQTFALPEDLHRPGGEIGIISHAPHLMRIIHMLNQYKPLPEDMTVRLFPIATPPEGREEYATLEIKGLLYYVFKGKNADAVAYPSIIHGVK